MTNLDALFEKHRGRLEAAISACETREAWTPFQESPSRKLHPAGAKEAGFAEVEGHLNSSFPLQMPGEVGRLGHEVSPYTNDPLGIDYPAVDVDALFDAMKRAGKAWARVSPKHRVALCMEMLDRLSQQTFANAYATMHTSGQAFMMAFAGSGANSLDRGLEALAYAHKAMSDIPETATFRRSFGGEPVTLKKRYRLMPVGPAVVITCGSYPAWNAYPAIFANLATGNSVVVKPHPNGILPVAMAIKTCRDTLSEFDIDPNVLTMAADEKDAPVTKKLVEHPDAAIIDFTGSQRFGAWLEENCRHAQVYTETSGCNAVVVESVADLDGTLKALATSVSLFSAQMCTAAQNIFVPEVVDTDKGELSYDQFVDRFVAAVEALTINPKVAAAICGAVHSEATLENVSGMSKYDMVLESRSYEHPEFPNARTATPVVVRCTAEDEFYRQEHFGPVAFLIRCSDAQQALQRATEDAKNQGSIANYAYSTNPEFLEQVYDAFAEAGASVGCNLVGQSPINFTAAYSDYHVTGLNPAGNACLTDLAFVTSRFRIVQSKTEVMES